MHTVRIIVAAGITLLLAAGALFAEPARHWAYVRPERPPLPAVDDGGWCRTPIDAFVLERMRLAGFQPAPEATRETLIRRVTFDLTGLPPTPEQVDRFLADRSPDAYERLVDRLLASPRYGERMATPWLDAARYADTHGYHADSHRDMWAWRDWVVGAWNRNMPFDEFTIEQLAGDLLPGATDAQRLASGMHRNTMLNFEQGAIAEEYLTEYVADRVMTTATVWLGQTLQCARCHDHPYDPFTQRDYYRLFAYFNNVSEQGLDGRTGNAAPLMPVPTAEQRVRLEQLDAEIARLTQLIERRRAELAARPETWLPALEAEASTSLPPADTLLYCPFDESEGQNVADESGRPAGQLEGSAQWITAGRFHGALLLDGESHVTFDVAQRPLPRWDRHDAFSVALWIYPTTRDPMTLLAMRGDDRAAPGWELAIDDGRLRFEMTHDADKNTLAVHSQQPIELRRWQHVALTYDGSSRAAGAALYVNGKQQELVTDLDALTGTIAGHVPLRLGRRLDAGFRGMVDELRLYGRALDAAEAARLAGSDPLAALLAIAPEQRTAAQSELLLTEYLRHVDELTKTWQHARQRAQLEMRELRRAVPTVMVMDERPERRPTFVFERGDYQRPGEQVEPGVPELLLPAGDLPPNRLGLALWLTDSRHPLTARVTVNWLWQLCFGTGLVATPEDFGTRGEPPSHPELLDWLAVELVDSGWDVKHLLRMMVCSATYRQSSHVGEEAYAQDPENRWLARGSRRRLSAEMIRDAALAASGLLVERMGGPGVFPYQPEGLWEAIAYNPEEFTAQVYVPSRGADLYRRSLYTFWKRTSPPPGLTLFDAPNRETCVVRRSTSNTALQALVLMNDPTYVEAARGLAEHTLLEETSTDDARLDAMFRRVLARRPSDAERSLLHAALARMRAHFAEQPESAAAFLRVGDAPLARPLDSPDVAAEVAAWTTLASSLLNLDEAISRP